MTTVPFSIRLDEDTKSRLEKYATLEDRSASYLVQKAIEVFLNDKDQFYDRIAKAEAELDKGVFISEEAMDAWVTSWGTTEELPKPEPDIFPGKAKAPNKAVA
jgi:predicted transcriptional regulator